ncbi:MAG: retropepsin-like aspartic protease [Dehalococcoidia bacterium]
MRIVGEWFECDDGITRPVVRVHVLGVTGSAQSDRFLIDSGADRTSFSAAFLHELQLPVRDPPPGLALEGIGGTTSFALVRSTIEFVRDDGGAARVRGEFAAFTDPEAVDLSILGRDVLDNFDLNLSRRRNEVLLLASNHHYQVSRV